jgi:hypothetical protein
VPWVTSHRPNTPIAALLGLGLSPQNWTIFN